MLRVLFVTARRPYPLNDGWKIRTFHLIKGWKEAGACVDLIGFSDSAEAAEDFNSLRELCCETQYIARDKSYAWQDLVKGLIFPKPFTIYNYTVPKMHKCIDKITSKTSYDIIQIEDVVMAQYQLSERHGRVCILDMHNVESHLLQRYARKESSLFKKFYAILTAKKLRNYEIKTCSKFDRVIVCSDKDRDILKSYEVQVEIDVLPNGVDCDYFKPNRCEASGNDLVFIGSMDYHANISGVIHFVNNVLPLIWEVHPEVRFLIVGKNPSEAIRRLSSERIIVTGMVPDVRPYLDQARIVVVPLLVGGGTRLKILEAMAMGMAIVSTSLGAEGIPATHEQHFMLADGNEVFAERVLELTHDPVKCKIMGTAARRFVESYFGWSLITRKLSESVL